MRDAMDEVHREQQAFTEQYGGAPIDFGAPYCGVHLRKWRNNSQSLWSKPLITIECDPGYAGIGATLEPGEARKLAQALLRAAEVAESEIH